jgi:WhiB family redox-sensing transcriptional regulator
MGANRERVKNMAVLRNALTGRLLTSSARTGSAMVEELGWQEDALCAQTDPESFFPSKGGSTKEAKRVCLTCEVRGQCLEYALTNEERFGIWGGMSERERRKLSRARRVLPV